MNYLAKKFTMLVFALTLVVGFSTHLYRLDHFPPALNLDEVVMGYDAYSILQTSRDQYGRFLPIYFQSHDDYKPPFIIYAIVPSLAIFGLTDFAVRFPSAVLGFLTIIFTFLFVKELFKKIKEVPPTLSTKLALLSGLLLSVSPWHLQFSRTSYEVGIQPLLTVAGLFFFLKALNTNRIFVAAISGLVLSLGTHLYTASRVFIPLLVFFTSVIYSRALIQSKKLLFAFILALAVFLVPTIYLFTTPAGQTRFKGTNIFQDPVAHERTINRKIIDWLARDRLAASIFHPEKLSYAPEVLYGYLSHLRLDFIYLGRTDGSTNYVPNTGLAYLVELPFLLYGLFRLFTLKNKKPAYLLIGWLLLAPVPASVTYGIPTSIRTTIILPSLQIITAFGILSFWGRVKMPKIKFASLVLFAFVFCYSVAQYLEMYYVQAPIERDRFWYTSYRQVALTSQKLSHYYDQVIVSTSLDQPQSFFLYYLKMDPGRYLQDFGGTVSGSYAETRNHFDKFYFKPINWDKMESMKNTLFVGRPQEFPENAPIIKTFFSQSGKAEVVIVGKEADQ